MIKSYVPQEPFLLDPLPCCTQNIGNCGVFTILSLVGLKKFKSGDSEINCTKFYSVIRRVIFPYLNIFTNLDLSYKMDLWCFDII